MSAPQPCQNPGCGRRTTAPRRGWCSACYGRWYRAACDADEAPPASQCRHGYDPAAPPTCRDCRRVLGPAEGQHCAACRTYRARTGNVRTPAMQAAWTVTRTMARVRRETAAPRRARHLRNGAIILPDVGWVPPAGYCKPGESYGQVQGCGRCALRVDCAALSRTEVA